MVDRSDMGGRRAQNDFVVDDEGIGYRDDGEEHLGIAEDPSEVRKRAIAEEIERDDSRNAKRLKKLVQGETNQRNSILQFARAGLGSKERTHVVNEAPPGILPLDRCLGADLR